MQLYQISVCEAHSSIHSSCSHSSGWSGLHCSSFLVAVRSQSPRVEDLQVVKESKDTDSSLIESYHTPYTPKYHYWTGLLLIFRAVLYLITAANISNDLTIALTVITFTMGCVILLKGFIGSQLYKNWLLDTLENFLFQHLYCGVYLVLSQPTKIILILALPTLQSPSQS